MYEPKFRYPTASGTQLVLTLPMRHWRQPMKTIGGFRESASGTARAARTIRRDRLLEIICRIHENELPAFRSMIEWAQDNPNQGIDFWPDAAVPGTVFVVYFTSPMIGEDFDPPRSTEFASVLEPTLQMRRTNGSAFDLVWYPD